MRSGCKLCIFTSGRPLRRRHGELLKVPTIILGDFNIDWLVETERRPIYNLLVRDNGYKQLISSYTTDNKTLIDHIYTNILHLCEVYMK